MCKCRPIFSSLSGRAIDRVCLMPAHFLPLMSCFLQRLPKPGGLDSCLVILYCISLHWNMKENASACNYELSLLLCPVLDTGHSGAVDSGHRDTEQWPPETTGHQHSGHWLDTGTLIDDWLPMCWTSFLSVFSAFLNNKPAQMLVNSI